MVLKHDIYQDNMNTLNLNSDGIQVVENFLNQEELASLRQELDHLFSKNLIHGPGFSVYINPKRQEIPQAPSKILSVNLFEKAIDIIDILKSIDSEQFHDLQLAHVAVYRETKNPVQLTWHSDVRGGALTRAQIVIRGGDKNSGAFCYIPGSHKIKDIEYLPSNDYLKENKDNVAMMTKPNGSLFLVNTLGYHSRSPINTERVSIMFDFVNKDFLKQYKNDIGSNLLISFHQLSPKIINKLEYLQISIKPNSMNPNTPDSYRYSLKFGGYYLYVLKPIYWIRNIFKKTRDY